MSTLDNSIPFEELERRRRKTNAARKQSEANAAPKTDSEAMAVINEIFNPTLKLPESTGHYTLPEEVTAKEDLDISKLAELKEVFLFLDTDSDGLISKNDLRFTFVALGGEAKDDLLEKMLKEAKEPLDCDSFVELMTQRTVELDSEDVLLEAWSKWDDYGTGKIDEKNCFDYIEIFPYLREPVVENSTSPEYVICNGSAAAANGSDDSIASVGGEHVAVAFDLRRDEFIYSGGKILGIRMRFKQPPRRSVVDNWALHMAGEYRFLNKENFRNDGRLIPGSYCDYYFFADANATPKSLQMWQYFHSPRFPAKYPTHIKCAYKFIGRPESRVEIVFEELHIPKQGESCNMDKLTIFDSESANMNAVIDVICNALPTRHIVSSGPDLLIEFNASSNITAKGFRGKFKFLHNDVTVRSISTSSSATPTTTIMDSSTSSSTEAVVVLEKLAVQQQAMASNMVDLDKFIKHNGESKN